MGTENNECVIATTWSTEVADAVRSWTLTVDEEFQPLFVFIPSIANGKMTIIFAPCGSKKGWDTDKKAAELRAVFIQKLESFNYEDGSSPFDWVEVGYGEFGQKVLRGNCTNKYGDAEYAQ